MSIRQSRGYKMVMILGSIACLVGAGYLGYKTFLVKGGSATELKAAETAYTRGLEAMTSNPQEAAIRFDEATLLTKNGLDRLENDRKKGVPEEELKKIEARLCHLRSQALRDRAFAKAKADNKPIPEMTDGSSGEAYRAYTNIPEPLVFGDAHLGLKKSFELAPDNPEVIKDLTRLELSRQPLDWTVVENLLEGTIKLNPKDARAHYFLAKFEFEQPSASTNWQPLPADKRAGERVAKVREHLDQAKANGSPYWRTVHLEADLLAWQLDDAKRGKNKTDIDNRRQSLEKLLFDADGTLAKASKGDKFTALSAYDVDGIFGVHTLALNYVLGAEGSSGDKATRIKQVTESLLSTAREFGKSKSGESFAAKAGENVAGVLQAIRPYLATADQPGWTKLLGDAQAFFQEFPKAAAHPNVALMMAGLARDDTALEAALNTAKEKKLPPEQLAEYHCQLAMSKLMHGKPASEVEAHIKELRSLNLPNQRSNMNFIEGVLDERQGKLEAARKLLEAVTNDKEAKGTTVAFHSVIHLANITLATNDPGAAAGYLSQIADALKQTQKLDPNTRAWLEQGGMTPDSVTALQVKATVLAGLQRIDRMKRENPNTTIPVEAIRPVVETAERLAKPLRAPSEADRAARLALVQFYVTTNIRDLADRAIASLSTDYADSVEVLKAAVILLTRTESGKPDEAARAKADERIRQFLKLNPTNQKGKLFWAEWLISTRRNQQAIDYLRDPANFPNPDPVVNRMLAGALTNAGEREEARKVLGGLASDPAIDLALVQAAATREDAEKGLQSALSRYENNGLFRIYDGVNKLNQGKYEEAISELAAAREFSKVKAAATAALNQALVRFAGDSPSKAVPVIHKLITEIPEEPGLFQAAALGSLYSEDVGTPADIWGAKKTMYAAVNRWEQLAVKAGSPAADVGLSKAYYHLFAGNPTLARAEAIRVNGQHPNHVPTMLFLTEQFLAERDLDQAKVFLDRANTEAKADDPTPSLLEGTWLEQKQDWDAAAKLYERMMTQYAGNPAPFARRIAVANAQKKPGDALMWANKWVEKSPEDLNAALELIAQLATVEPKSDGAVKKADEFVNRQMTALEAQIKAAKPAPTAENVAKARTRVRAQAMLQTAIAFTRAKNFTEAKKRVNEVLKEYPDLPGALFVAGDIAMIEQKWDEAETYYRQRLKTEKRDFVAANNLAWVLAEKKNNPAEALKLVTQVRTSMGGKAIDAQRLSPDFLDTIGTVYLKLNDAEKFAEMRDTFEGAIKRYPTDPRMYSFLGQAYVALGEKANAVRSLKTAVRLASDPTVKTVSEEQKLETKKSAEAALKKSGN